MMKKYNPSTNYDELCMRENLHGEYIKFYDLLFLIENNLVLELEAKYKELQINENYIIKLAKKAGFEEARNIINKFIDNIM